MKRISRESCSIILVLLHLLVVPCATAMVLMPADMDCEHCQTSGSADACVVASGTAGAVSGGLAFDPGRFNQPLYRDSPVLPHALPDSVTTSARSRSFATRHSSDPPPYLLLGQLRL